MSRVASGMALDWGEPHAPAGLASFGPMVRPSSIQGVSPGPGDGSLEGLLPGATRPVHAKSACESPVVDDLEGALPGRQVEAVRLAQVFPRIPIRYHADRWNIGRCQFVFSLRKKRIPAVTMSRCEDDGINVLAKN